MLCCLFSIKLTEDKIMASDSYVSKLSALSDIAKENILLSKYILLMTYKSLIGPRKLLSMFWAACVILLLIMK